MKDIILNMLKKAGGFLSGETISRRLGVTRGAVWKAIRSLRQQGYTVEAVPNRGYRLAGLSDVLSEGEIRASIGSGLPAAFAKHIDYREAAGSTNQMARMAAESGAPSGSVFVAGRQTAGRGRRGRTWQSDHERGLWFSILLRPDEHPAVLSKLTLFASLCVVKALRQDFQIEAGIKWPNDVVSLVSDKKICGILTEAILEEQTAVTVIIGIGVNAGTREFPADLADTATSLFLESGRDVRRADLLAAILRQFAAFEDAFPDRNGWLDEYRRSCVTLGRDIAVIQGNGETFAGLAAEVNDNGELVVQDPDGHRRAFFSGEVSVRPARKLM